MKWLGLARRAHITSGPSHISRYSYCRASTRVGRNGAGRSSHEYAVRIRSGSRLSSESETVPRPYRDREQRYVFNSTGGGARAARELGSIGPCISYIAAHSSDRSDHQDINHHPHAVVRSSRAVWPRCGPPLVDAPPRPPPLGRRKCAVSGRGRPSRYRAAQGSVLQERMIEEFFDPNQADLASQ